jgi:hypothetical protein
MRHLLLYSRSLNEAYPYVMYAPGSAASATGAVNTLQALGEEYREIHADQHKSPQILDESG